MKTRCFAPAVAASSSARTPILDFQRIVFTPLERPARGCGQPLGGTSSPRLAGGTLPVRTAARRPQTDVIQPISVVTVPRCRELLPALAVAPLVRLGER